jgi:release factor glutamine methyltransferase
MTLRDALAEASASIARRDAETLIAHLLSRDRAWLFAHPDAELSAAYLEALRDLTARRATHEPLQYLTGIQDFHGLPLRVTRDTLIPRPETELLVEAVLGWTADWIAQQPAELAEHAPRILDVGTGTGALALALATYLPTADITATDLSPAALSVARDNAERLHLSDRVHFLLSDLLNEFEPELQAGAGFDAIVSNPPYVPLSDAATMQAEVVDYEPHTALFAGADGLDIYRRLIPQAHAALHLNGLLALEFGFGQREALRALFENPTNGAWQDLRFRNDYAGIPRIALATRA